LSAILCGVGKCALCSTVRLKADTGEEEGWLSVSNATIVSLTLVTNRLSVNDFDRNSL
jgi:hypothetical protein